MKIRVAIADDHPLILRGLQNLLRDHPDIEITGVYNNGDALLDAITEQQPEILLLDIQMPGKNGLEITGILSRSYPEIGIIALTNLDNQFYIRSMLHQGALGYILKNSGEATLIEAIKTVYEKQPYLEPSLRERAWRDMVKSQLHTGDNRHSLTRREKEILQLIAREHTSQEIAEKLFLSLRTVETHRMNLLLKLGAKNMVGLVKAAIQMGLVD